MMLLITIIFVVCGLVVSTPIDNEVDSVVGVDLSYLGSRIFGTPSEEVGEKLKNLTNGVNPEEVGEYAEGDILFPRKTRNGIVSVAARWKDAIIPYEISPVYTTQDVQMIKKAMDIYHKYTCIKFRPKQRTDKDYISIVNGNTGCWSSVGKINGKQEINLQSPYCTTKVGTPLHELMHAVGFVHEQNRWERDDYVTIAWQNIKIGHEGNFKKSDKGSIDGYGVAYDYRSVMHYSPTAFTVNGKPTIVPKDSSNNLKMGQRDGFSKGDILKINAMYGCPNKPPDSNKLPNSPEPDKENESNSGGGLLSLLFPIIH